jgi:hypothetical protein
MIKNYQGSKHKTNLPFVIGRWVSPYELCGPSMGLIL